MVEGITIQKAGGFTLVGAMIIVSIIILLAAIIIPRLLDLKMVDNESTAEAT